MTINPCCIPLKTGVRMITHVSMALALIVGWTSLRLISISFEVSSTLENERILPIPPPEFYPPRTSQNYPWFRDSYPFPPPYYYRNYPESWSSHQVLYPSSEFRVPYEYPYRNWHQLQNSQQETDFHNENHRDWPPRAPERELVAKPSTPKPAGGSAEDGISEENERIFRLVLHQRKNFKAESTTAPEFIRNLQGRKLRMKNKVTPKPSEETPSSPDPVRVSAVVTRPEVGKMMSMKQSLRDHDPHGLDSNEDFKQQYAKVLLVSGLLALCTTVFQFFTSFLLLCFVDKGSNAAAQIWTAVNCSVIFSLATCLVLFLCEGLSLPKYVFDEKLYLGTVALDSVFSIYFLWVVMAFI